MDKSALIGVALGVAGLGFIVFGVAMRYYWVNELYTPPKRKRRKHL